MLRVVLVHGYASDILVPELEDLLGEDYQQIESWQEGGYLLTLAWQGDLPVDQAEEVLDDIYRFEDAVGISITHAPEDEEGVLVEPLIIEGAVSGVTFSFLGTMLGYGEDGELYMT